jgi:hypothetical protein
MTTAKTIAVSAALKTFLHNAANQIFECQMRRAAQRIGGTACGPAA